MVDAFLAACRAGEIAALLPLLDPSVAGWADLGNLPVPFPQPSVGREVVAECVRRFFGPTTGTALIAREVNGEPGILAVRAGRAFAVMTLVVKDGLIARIYTIVDPAKLAQVQRALDQDR